MASTSWFKKNRSPDNDEEPDRACFFTYKELKKATGNFKKKLGDGGYGEVYKGKLSDGQTVAVKRLLLVNLSSMERFLDGVNVLYRYRHQNLVTFYGCTNPQEDNVLLLVYEFVSNGTLSDHLYGQRPALTGNTRIRIAIETAEALVYLHSLQPQVIHNQIKSGNILLNDALQVKVAGLGEHGILPSDTMNVQQGTVGYRDPEYRHTMRLTDKSNVYSFGVVLLELISGKPAIDTRRGADDIYLHHMAISKITNNKLDEFVDPILGYGSDEDVMRMIDSVVDVACKCVQDAASNRPPMVEVLKVLKGTKDGTNM